MAKDQSTEIYLIRHSQSLMNTNPHLIGGRSNETPITKLGIKQAHLLGAFMLSKKILPTNVCSSPAVRTQETAKYSLQMMGLYLQPTIEDEIQELGQGKSEGSKRIDIYTPEVMEQIKTQGKDFKLDGGESMNDVGSRMKNWVHKAVADLDQSEDRHTIFAYTHGGAITYLVSELLGWNHADTYAFQKTVDNTSVTKLKYTDGDIEVEYIANAEHLA